MAGRPKSSPRPVGLLSSDRCLLPCPNTIYLTTCYLCSDVKILTEDSKTSGGVLVPRRIGTSLLKLGSLSATPKLKVVSVSGKFMIRTRHWWPKQLGILRLNPTAFGLECCAPNMWRTTVGRLCTIVGVDLGPGRAFWNPVPTWARIYSSCHATHSPFTPPRTPGSLVFRSLAHPFDLVSTVLLPSLLWPNSMISSYTLGPNLSWPAFFVTAINSLPKLSPSLMTSRFGLSIRMEFLLLS